MTATAWAYRTHWRRASHDVNPSGQCRPAPSWPARPSRATPVCWRGRRAPVGHEVPWRHRGSASGRSCCVAAQQAGHGLPVVSLPTRQSVSNADARTASATSVDAAVRMKRHGWPALRQTAPAMGQNIPAHKLALRRGATTCQKAVGDKLTGRRAAGTDIAPLSEDRQGEVGVAARASGEDQARERLKARWRWWILTEAQPTSMWCKTGFEV